MVEIFPHMRITHVRRANGRIIGVGEVNMGRIVWQTLTKTAQALYQRGTRYLTRYRGKFVQVLFRADNPFAESRICTEVDRLTMRLLDKLPELPDDEGPTAGR